MFCCEGWWTGAFVVDEIGGYEVRGGKGMIYQYVKWFRKIIFV